MDDSAVVQAIAANDPEGLDAAYRRYSKALFAYSRAMLGDRDAAADAVHEAFVLASSHIGQLRDPSRLRPWLYAIVRHQGLRVLRQRSRQAPLEAAGDPAADLPDAIAAMHSAQVAELVKAAMAGLTDAGREVAELALRHGHSPTDLAAVLGISPDTAQMRLTRAREQLLASLGVLLVARQQPRACARLEELLGGWDGLLTPLLRKRLDRHIRDCPVCSREREERLDPAALLSGYAIMVFVELPRPRLKPTSGLAAPRWNPADGFPVQPDAPRRSRLALAVAAGVVLLIAAVGGAVAATQGADAELPAIVPQLSRSATPGSTTPSIVDTPSLTPASTTPALSFTAEASATCFGFDGYRLTVNVTANSPLASANVYWMSNTRAMTVNGRKAQAGPLNGNSTLDQITWHVEIRATDGRTLRGPDRHTSHPC